MLRSLLSRSKFEPPPHTGLPGLPDGWRYERLRTVAELRVSGVNKLSVSDEDPVRLCNYTDVYKNDYIVDGRGYMRATATHAEIARFRLEHDDVVITKDSETWNDIAVPAYVAYAAPDFVCAYHLAILRTRKAVVFGSYLHHALREPSIANQFHLAAGGVTRFGLTQGAIKSALVPVPPLGEQSLIVKYLGHAHARIDRAIAAKRKLIALLEEQKQAIIHHAVTRGLDPSVPLKDSGIPWLTEIPAHWDSVPLSRCFASMVYGTSENARGDGPVTVIGMGDIRAGEVRVTGAGGLDAVPVGLELEPGDLLFNRTNSPSLVGKVGLYRNARREDVSFASYLVRLRPLAGFTSEWLVALLNSPDFLRFAQGQALMSLHQANLNPRRYGRLTIPVPPVGERAEIAAALEGMVVTELKAISTVSTEIRLLQEFRTRLTSDVVTGQIDVREIAATLPELTDDALRTGDDLAGEDSDVDISAFEVDGADD